MGSVNKVAVDTNMLIAINQFKFDFFNEVKREFGKVDFVVPKKVIEELEKIAGEGKKNLSSVRIAKELMNKEEVKEVETEATNADDALVELAGKEIIVATNDVDLKNRVKEVGGKVIFLRQKKFLEII